MAKKTPVVLDDMIEHVRYEVVQLISFATIGRGFCAVLRPDLGDFAAAGILEAGLVHARCLSEFLGSKKQRKGQVYAWEYVEGWSWKEPVGVGDLHARLAHLGVVRSSVAIGGSHDWAAWLNTTVPVLLDTFRRFLLRLSDGRRERFNQPRPELPKMDLVAVIDALLPRPGAVGHVSSNR